MTNSIVIPVYRNAENIPSLLSALEQINQRVENDLEVIFVMDGSPDESGRLLLDQGSRLSFPGRLVFLSRNFGSFTAIRTGLEVAEGKFVAVMAADLQEPPELILEFFKILAANQADIVFGQREGRNDPILNRVLSITFWRLYRRLVLPAMPEGGVDIFACNRSVLDAVLTIEEPNSSLIAQLFWVGFRRSFVPYRRLERQQGQSAWNFSRR
ncbi:MAG: glycosyltransferase family 2 protein, partial [Methylococcales bacterium]